MYLSTTRLPSTAKASERGYPGLKRLGWVKVNLPAAHLMQSRSMAGRALNAKQAIDHIPLHAMYSRGMMMLSQGGITIPRAIRGAADQTGTTIQCHFLTMALTP